MCLQQPFTPGLWWAILGVVIFAAGWFWVLEADVATHNGDVVGYYGHTLSGFVANIEKSVWMSCW